ncbi:MAG: hypothetical protein WCK89_15480 [bacterium]
MFLLLIAGGFLCILVVVAYWLTRGSLFEGFLVGLSLAMSRVWTSSDGNERVIAAKGAPEAIADLCHLFRHLLRRYRGPTISCLRS